MSAEIIAFKKRDKPKVKLSAPLPSRRLEGLDALRGLCVIAAVLLSAFTLPAPRWHGLNPADLIYAGLLFCAGMAIPLSFAARAARQSRRRLMLHVVTRTAILVGLGVIVSNVPGMDIAHLRLAGSLQYAGIGYGAAAVFCLTLGRKSDADFLLRGWPVAATAAAALALYAGLLLAWRSADCAGACFDSDHSLPAWLDAAVFGHADFVPLALTGFLGAFANVLLGVVVALYVRKQGARSSLIGLVYLGVLLLLSGASLDRIIPVIGPLWTPSFALVSGGMALLAFTLVAALGEIPGVRLTTYPLRVLGGNALLAFIAATLAARLWPMTPLEAGLLLLAIGLPLWGLYLRRLYLAA